MFDIFHDSKRFFVKVIGGDNRFSSKLRNLESARLMAKAIEAVEKNKGKSTRVEIMTWKQPTPWVGVTEYPVE